jgi:hypothetical protein
VRAGQSVFATATQLHRDVRTHAIALAISAVDDDRVKPRTGRIIEASFDDTRCCRTELIASSGQFSFAELIEEALRPRPNLFAKARVRPFLQSLPYQ